MNISCLLYRIYDWSKSTWLISQLFYGGKKYQHFEDVSVGGRITAINGRALDGDVTFDIETKDFGPLHCEFTPCYKFSKDLFDSLKVGQRVWVDGTRTFDPAHLGDADKWEIHPVKHIVNFV